MYHVSTNLIFQGKKGLLLTLQNYHISEFCVSTWGSRKKSSSLNGGAIKAYPPPPLSPLSLMAVGTLERWKKRFHKKVFFP